MSRALASPVLGTGLAGAMGAVDGFLASGDASAGRSQTSFWARAGIAQSAGVGIGVYGILEPRARPWTEPILLAAVGLMTRTAAFAIAQRNSQVHPLLAQGDTALNLKLAGPLDTPSSVFVYGPASNHQQLQASGLL